MVTVPHARNDEMFYPVKKTRNGTDCKSCRIIWDWDCDNGHEADHAQEQ